MHHPLLSPRALGGLAIVATLFLSACGAEEQALWNAHISSPQVQAHLVSTRSPRTPSDETLTRLRFCESKHDYRAVSRSGTYRGAYQFSRRTWNNVARQFLPQFVGVDPIAAPEFVQDAMARALWSQQGWRPWPVCGRRS